MCESGRAALLLSVCVCVRVYLTVYLTLVCVRAARLCSAPGPRAAADRWRATPAPCACVTDCPPSP